MVDVLVMLAVIRSPVEGRIFEGARAEKKGRQLYGLACLERFVGEEAMVAEGDAHPRGDEVKDKKGNLEEIDPEVVDVNRGTDEGGEKGDDEKDTGYPVDAV